MPLQTLDLVLLVLAGFAALASGAACAAVLRLSRGGGDGADQTAELLRRELAELRRELDVKASTQRTELNASMATVRDSLDKRLGGLTDSLNLHFTAFAEVQQKSGDNLAETQRQRLNETNAAVGKLSDTLAAQQIEARKVMVEELEKVRTTLTGNLEQLRKENEGKLEQMRLTVDEKLQGTLEKRLGESFKQVSERLQAVHEGLGEMKTLATGVGDLKRVLTNVKTRGGWGEVQLGALLEEMLAPEQYEQNACIEPGSAQRVEYAVKMPGQGEGATVLLPIDAKFPHEDYDRLLTAQEAGDAVAIEAASKALERAVKLQARTICDSYVRPPHSTDFAVMYLPTEGLYAEVARRPGLVRELQSSCRVMVAGPSNLAAFLNSLQMGFRTLAIQKRSSEVWQVLGEAKTEFQKYGAVWDKLGKQLDTARRTVDEAGKRTRAVERRLRGVEAVEYSTGRLVAIEGGLLVGPDAEEDEHEHEHAPEEANAE